MQPDRNSHLYYSLLYTRIPVTIAAMTVLILLYTVTAAVRGLAGTSAGITDAVVTTAVAVPCRLLMPMLLLLMLKVLCI